MQKVIKALKNNTNKMVKACTKPDTSKNYIIVVGSLSVTPDSSCRKGVRNGFPHSVERFHKTEAIILAHKCSNRGGEIGVARYWRAETEDAIIKNEKFLEIFGETLEKK